MKITVQKLKPPHDKQINVIKLIFLHKLWENLIDINTYFQYK